MKNIRYESLPEHCRNSMQQYIEIGRPVGGFLTAVLENNLVEAYARADDINIARMFDYAKFLYCDAPSECWGSRAKVNAWIEKHRLARTGKMIDEEKNE